MTEIDRSSRTRMTARVSRYFEGDTLFMRLGRAVCRAEALSRKEFFETWEVARRVRRFLREGPVFELAAGHGFLAMSMILLEDGISTATCVDRSKPPSHERLLASLEEEWPRLSGRVTYRETNLAEVDLPTGSLVVSVHGCGTVTDRVLDAAIAARCPVAVLPCCHDLSRSDDGGLKAWMEATLAIDATRASRLASAGYRVTATTIPEDITPRNRLLIGRPVGTAPSSR